MTQIALSHGEQERLLADARTNITPAHQGGPSGAAAALARMVSERARERLDRAGIDWRTGVTNTFAPAKGAAGAATISASKADLQAAVAAERQRWATVLASPAAQGQMANAVTLLSDPRGWTAVGIVQALADNAKATAPAAPAPAPKADTPKPAGQSVALWERAYSANNSRTN
jgi:hypothetical protein